MKSFIFIIIILLILPQNLSANQTKCFYPESLENYSEHYKTEREIFRKDGYLIIIDYYSIKSHPVTNALNKFHFENIKKLAAIYLEYPKKLDVDDYWDKEGIPTPYILLEIGGFPFGNILYDIGEHVIIGTCVDRKGNDPQNLRATNAKYYEEILESIHYVFIPILNAQLNE